MKRIRYTEGQLPLIFEIEAEAAQQSTVATQPEVQPTPVFPTPVPVKSRVRVPFSYDKPSVTLHKAGRKILVKANDPIAADVWREIRVRAKAETFRNTQYYLGDPQEIPRGDLERIECWRHLKDNLEQHPFCRILQAFGITVFITDNLRNFMRKEARRQELENTPFPVAPIETTVQLFDRCSEGTVLRCTQDYTPANGDKVVFKKDSRYMVLSTGTEGKDVVSLSTEPVRDKIVLSMLSNSKIHEWTSFHPAMEGFFSDSEEHEVGENLEQKYPKQVQKMREKLAKLNLPLYNHVANDVVLMALKRGGINAYPMRMGKTSFAIAWALLREYRSVGMVAPRNARIHAVKEFKRLGLVEDKDFVVVDALSDMEKSARFYLISSTWLRRQVDLSAKDRSEWKGRLRPSVRHIRTRIGETKEYETVSQALTNPCPHCEEPMSRLVRIPGPTQDGVKGIIIHQNGRETYWRWTVQKGYRCLNAACSYKTDNREKAGTGFKTKNQIKHTGGYVDYTLAAHASCKDVKFPGRMCPDCRQSDSVWKPAPYKRLKKRFKATIIDEVHSCKDPKTDTAKSSFGLRGKGRLALSGTLISNSPMDVYYPLSWTLSGPHTGFPYTLNPGFKEFDSRFCDAITLEKTVGENVNEVTGARTAITKSVRKRVPFLKNPADFWRFMSPKVIRRSYEDPMYQAALAAAGMKMPTSEIHKFTCPMDKDQARIMLASIKDFKEQFEKMVKEAKKKQQDLNPALVISQMSMLRRVATCPETLNTQFQAKVYKGVAGGGKRQHIYNLTRDAIGHGKKVVVLSDYLQMQETCNDLLKEFNPIRFNVGWDDEARAEAFEAFQTEEEHRVWIASTRAIREGADLSAADICICADMLWSPAFQTQAWSRILTPTPRERKCDIYLMVSANSLDDHIYGVFYSKLIAAQQAMDRKVLNRRAHNFDVKWFVERVLEEESAITSYLAREDEDDSDTMIIPGLDASSLSEREL